MARCREEGKKKSRIGATAVTRSGPSGRGSQKSLPGSLDHFYLNRKTHPES